MTTSLVIRGIPEEALQAFGSMMARRPGGGSRESALREFVTQRGEHEMHSVQHVLFATPWELLGLPVPDGITRYLNFHGSELEPLGILHEARLVSYPYTFHRRLGPAQWGEVPALLTFVAEMCGMESSARLALHDVATGCARRGSRMLPPGFQAEVGEHPAIFPMLMDPRQARTMLGELGAYEEGQGILPTATGRPYRKLLLSFATVIRSLLAAEARREQASLDSVLGGQ